MAAFTTYYKHKKHTKDVRLVERNLPPEYFNSEFEKLQSNKYRVMSEIYKDILALRDIGFKDTEIADMMRGRRAVSKADINALLLGIFNPDKPPTFRQDSGIIKAVEQINRELGTNYTINDFIDFKGITDIAKNTAKFL